MLKFYCGTLVLCFALVVQGADSTVRSEDSRSAAAGRRARLFVPSAPADLKLPSSFRLVAAYGPLLLIETDRPISRKELAALRRLPGIQAAALDSVVLRPLADHAAGKKTTEAKRAVEPCSLMERCPNGKPKFWAQDVMMAPSMHSDMQSVGISESTEAQVAVVDSGFDASQEASFESIGGVHADRGAKLGEEHPHKKYFGVSTYRKDVEVLGAPSKDENGHGTMVSSTIAGAGGMGVAKSIHLSVYRVTEPGDGGSTASGYLDMAMLRQANSGAEKDCGGRVSAFQASGSDRGGTRRLKTLFPEFLVGAVRLAGSKEAFEVGGKIIRASRSGISTCSTSRRFASS